MNPVSYIGANQAMIVEKMNHAFDKFQTVKVVDKFAYDAECDWVEGTVSVGNGIDSIMTLRYDGRTLKTKEDLEWEFNADIGAVYFNAMRELGQTKSRHNFKIQAINLNEMTVSLNEMFRNKITIPLKGVSESELVYDGKTLYVDRIDALFDKWLEAQPKGLQLQSTSAAGAPESASMPMPHLQL